MMDGVDGLAPALYRIDLSIFLRLHAATRPSAPMLDTARILADAPLVLSGALVGYLLLRPGQRQLALEAALAAALGLLVNYLLAMVWYRPRPFIAGAGQAWIQHAATSSFPSDHLTVQCCVAGFLLCHRPTRPLGLGVAMLGLPMAWARIYLGVHYPGDMLGALLVATAIVATGSALRSQVR